MGSKPVHVPCILPWPVCDVSAHTVSGGDGDVRPAEDGGTEAGVDGGGVGLVPVHNTHHTPPRLRAHGGQWVVMIMNSW